MTGGGNVSQMRVCIRVRPPNLSEIESNAQEAVRVVDENFLVFDPKRDDAPEFYQGQRRKLRDMTKRRTKDMKFAFDHVFGPDVTQEFVYEKSTKDMVDTLVSGFNCTVFAYGATGAGKTFTMLGAMDRPGVMYHTMLELYKKINEEEKQSYSIAISYLEVYNEQIHDLLMPRKNLALREDPKKGTVVSGLSVHQPQSADELMQMLATGNLARTQHPTDANKQSSRSHAVFQVFLRQKDRTASMSEQYALSKMTLIDLAGSERATVTTNRGARFREGANINKSLLALGNCINALADPKHKGHIPYRNSKLTRLLKDSLGGNCRTVMIAAVSPAMSSYEDTYSTLRYADRAKNIRSSLRRNIVNVELHVSRYPAVIDKLKRENAALKAKILKYESGALPTARSSSHSVPVSKAVLQPLSSTSKEILIKDLSDDDLFKHEAALEAVYRDKQSSVKDVLRASSEMKLIEFTTGRRQEEIARINAFTNPSTKEKATCRMERVMAANQARQVHKTSRLESVRRKYDEINTKVQDLKCDITKETNSIPRELALCLRIQDLSTHVTNLEMRHDHVLKLALKSEAAMNASDGLILQLLKFTKKQFYLLKDHNLVTNGLEQEFYQLQKQVEGAKEVAWADEQNASLALSEEDSINSCSAVSVPIYDLPLFEKVKTNPEEFLALCSVHARHSTAVTKPMASAKHSLMTAKPTMISKPPTGVKQIPVKSKSRVRQLFGEPTTSANNEHTTQIKTTPRKFLRSSKSVTNLSARSSGRKRNRSNEECGRPKKSRHDIVEAKVTTNNEENAKVTTTLSEDKENIKQDDEKLHASSSDDDELAPTSVQSDMEMSNVDLNSTFTIEANTSSEPLSEITTNQNVLTDKNTNKKSKKRKAETSSFGGAKKKSVMSAAQSKLSAEMHRLGITSVVATMSALPGFMKPTATSRARAIKGEMETLNNKPSKRKKLHRRSKSLSNLSRSYK